MKGDQDKQEILKQAKITLGRSEKKTLEEIGISQEEFNLLKLNGIGKS